MAERRTKPVDWQQTNPDVGEFLENDRQFLSISKKFFEAFSSGDQALASEAFEMARETLQARDNQEFINDQRVSEELGNAFLFLDDDPDYLSDAGRTIDDSLV